MPAHRLVPTLCPERLLVREVIAAQAYLRLAPRSSVVVGAHDAPDRPVPQGFPGGQARHSPGAFVPKRIPIGAGGEAANYHPAATLSVRCPGHRTAIAQRSPLVRFSQSSGHRVPLTRFSASATPASPRGLNPQGNPSSEREVRGQLPSWRLCLACGWLRRDGNCCPRCGGDSTP